MKKPMLATTPKSLRARPGETEVTDEDFDRLWRSPGTRCNRIMEMIEAGETDEHIAKVVHADDAMTIALYRKALMQHKGLIPFDMPPPEPITLTSSREAALALMLYGMGYGVTRIARMLEIPLGRAKHYVYRHVKERHGMGKQVDADLPELTRAEIDAMGGGAE